MSVIPMTTNKEYEAMSGANRLLMLMLCLLLMPAAGWAQNFFPYDIQKKTLDNGLDVIVIETPEFKDVVNWNTLILAGSRNEVEKGRTGLAHLFEHISFRHKYGDPANAYETRMEKIGAFDNAWTWFDVTYYHPVTFRQNLDELAKVQAERFLGMDFSEQIYRTEGGAVLGEYRRVASDPSLRMEEVLDDLVYGHEHGYGHTTMGYLADVKDMPNSYKSGKAFYETWYRPNNAVVIVVGDVKADEVFPLVEKTYGPWKQKEVPKLPAVPALNGPKTSHVAWPSDVPPRVDYSYEVPAFEPGSRDSSVILLLSELLGGQTAPLYQKLRYEKKVATSMFVGGQPAEGFDPRPLEVNVRIDKDLFDKQGEALIKGVESDIEAGFDELKNFSARPDAATTLTNLKSRFRYDLLSGLDSPAHIAETFAWFYKFDRSPKVFEEMVQGVNALTPQDIDQFAKTYFVPSRRAVVTMWHEGGAQ